MKAEDTQLTHGQGKRVTTLLTEDGCYVPVISHAPYNQRRNLQSAPFSAPEDRGPRRHSLHNTTFTLGEKGNFADFMTTTKQNYGGDKSLNPVKRPPKCRSMHQSQLDSILANKTTIDHGNWNTDYSNTYYSKQIIPANRLHLSSLENKLSQNEGKNITMIVRPNTTVASYWSQYGRIHSKLGHILGPGEPHDYPIRQQYNTITGENNGAAWKEQNARISGNRRLHLYRKNVATTPIIS